MRISPALLLGFSLAACDNNLAGTAPASATDASAADVPAACLLYTSDAADE